MNTILFWFGEKRAAKAVVLLVVFLIVLLPVSRAWAQEPAPVQQPVAEAPSDTPVSEPTTEIPTVEETPTEEKPTEEPEETKEQPTEEEETTDEEEEPQQNSLLGQQEEDNANNDTAADRLPSYSTTGALTYQYPIVVPPGRNGLQPDLLLSYNSQSASVDNIADTVFGSGWSMNIPYIQRINRTGLEDLYSATLFESSMNGELLSTGSGNFVAKDETGDFLKYSLSSNVWTVTDKRGTVYKFGTNAGERQDNPGDSSKIYKWLLQEVRDTNNNYIKYECYKDDGQIYPYKITYTGNGSTDGIFQVEFLREVRSDVLKTFFPGFEVKTDFRIHEIQTKISGSWVRKYELDYSTGNNGLHAMLSSITESGRDESSNTTTLPASTYTYKTNSTITWATQGGWALPEDLPIASSTRASVPADINGDGWTDLLSEVNDGNGNFTKSIYMNDGDGTWTKDPSGWALPDDFAIITNANRAFAIADINGDMLPDLISEQNSGGYVNYVFINNGDGTWDDTTWDLPTSNWGIIRGAVRGGAVTDVNGDSLADLLYTYHNGGGDFDSYLYLNNGDGTWSTNGSWNLPDGFGLLQSSSWGATTADVNNDGLTDLLQTTFDNGTSTWIKKIFLNKGNGVFAEDAAWNLPTNGILASSTIRGNVVADVNADGFVDILHEFYDPGTSSYTTNYYMNKGDGTWTDQTSDWTLPFHIVKTVTKTHMMADMDADGVLDFIYAENLGNDQYDTEMYFHNREVFDVLGQITYSEGGTTTVNYQNSPLYKDGATILNPALPIPLYTVKDVTHADGLGGTNMALTYKYEGGDYYWADEFDRKFSGFNKITTTDSAGNKTLNFYHQGNGTDSSNGEYSDHISKIGQIYRTEVQDSSSNVYLKTVQKWDKYDLGSGRNFVKKVRATELTYDGDSDHKDKAEEYTYENTYGNLTERIEWGEVTGSNDGSFTDTGSDKFATTISYATNTTPYIMALPSQDTKVDQNSNKVNENKYYYDSQSLGSVTDGNMTKQEMWKTSSTYIDIEKTYNTTYGIVTQEKDPRNKTTDYTYDSYNLYPTTVENALSQETDYEYDYSLGKPKETTDPNGRVFQTIYDGLDRVTAEKQPDLTTPSTLVNKTTYAYTDTSGAVKVQRTDHLDGSTSVDTYTYFDGLHRPIQVRLEMEDSNTYAVTDTVYSNIGKIHKESVPYSSSGSSKTSPTTTSNLLITYSYDPMQRISSVVNAIGTTSNAYNDWKQTITDPRSRLKHLYSDAYGNLVRVDETNSGSTYSTYYEYNGNKNLTKITDALSNVRNFTYDGLGRRLTAQDLHASGDNTFGSWTYTYDDSGNLTSVVDPKSQTINYTYDDINRVSTEDYTGQGSTEVIYIYDSGTDGVGRLTSVTAPGANSAYVYNPHGLIKQETKTINSTGYQTDYTRDRLGNVLEVINPDSSKVKYTYNTAGQLETVQRKESTDGSFINLVTDFDYGPHGKITYQAYTNGAATTNTYDSTKMYRLSNKTTTITGGSKMQDLTYTYDANSNVTQIVDASNTNSSKTVAYTYDDLNRLLSATATNVASGQSTYTHSYTYNAIGNIITRTDSAGTYSYAGDQGGSYANPHAVTSIGSTSYTYDNNGNMLIETSGLSNTWDYNNRLTQAVKGGVTSTYTYDHTGQRVKLANGTTTTYYPSDNYNTDGTTPVKHISTPSGETLATVKGTGASAAIYSVHTDSLTGSNVVTNSNGTQEELIDYFAYGNIRIDQKAGSFDEQRKFAGHEYDTDTSLSYAGARYYYSSIGRFISQDPAFLKLDQLDIQLSDPQSWNSYAYARNNPLALVDPDGNMWTPWQSSGSVGKWMGNGAFLHNVYGGNVDRITVQAQDIKVNGPSVQNVTAIAKEAGSVAVKTAAVSGGAIVLGAGAGIVAQGTAISTMTQSPLGPLITSQGATRGGISAGVNIANQAIDDQITENSTSFGDYIKIGAVGYGSGAMFGNQSIGRAMVGTGGLNAISQGITGDGSIDPVQVGASMLGTGFSSYTGNYLSKASSFNNHAFKQAGLSKIGWSLEAPINIIKAGIRKKK